MKKKDQPPAESSFAPGGISAPRLTAEDIQAKEFRIARFRGYKERDVDEFLDELTLAWGALADENRRLRSQTEVAPAIGAPDLDDVSRQADEILARAREEASRIAREAEERAGLAGAGAADRVAVSAFLSKEREFLQELASLVQAHAEGVKGMAREVFRPASTSSSEGAPDVRAPDVRAPAPAAAAQAAGTPSVTTAPEGLPVATPETDSAPEPKEEPIRVEEPEPATVGAPENDDDGSESGDRSLKELFWGEE